MDVWYEKKLTTVWDEFNLSSSSQRQGEESEESSDGGNGELHDFVGSWDL